MIGPEGGQRHAKIRAISGRSGPEDGRCLASGSRLIFAGGKHTVDNCGPQTDTQAGAYASSSRCEVSRRRPGDIRLTHSERQSVSELLAGARAGNDSARETLFESCRGYLGVVAQAQVESWLRAKVDASDLVQQTMLEACRDFGRFDGTDEVQWLAWLRRILNHNAADFVRRYRGTEKRQARREVSLAAGSDQSWQAGRHEPAAAGESPSAAALRVEDELRLASAIDRLAPDYRQVILLRNISRLPFEEVARCMERSRPAVQMLWGRAIQKLRDEMTDAVASDRVAEPAGKVR